MMRVLPSRDPLPRQRLPLLVVLIIALCAPVWADDDDDHGGGSGKPKEQYELTVSGYFEGQGQAKVKDDDTIQIQAQVHSVDGKVNLSLPKIVGRFARVDGEVIGTFSGKFTVAGKLFVLSGRIEPPTEDAEARLTGFYTYGDDQAGRLVGHIKNSKKNKGKGNGNNGNGKGNGGDDDDDDD